MTKKYKIKMHGKEENERGREEEEEENNILNWE